MHRAALRLMIIVAFLLGFWAWAAADEITISLAGSMENLRFEGSMEGGKKDTIFLSFSKEGSFHTLTGNATSVRKVQGKKDRNDMGDYALKYLEGVTLALRHEKGQDTNTWTVEQTGSARFIQFCYAKNIQSQCTRQPNPPALLESTFNFRTFQQNPNDKNGMAVFNFAMEQNLFFFNKPPPPQQRSNVGGDLLKGEPQFVPPGVLTLTVNLGKGFDLNTLAGKDQAKDFKLTSGQATIDAKKPPAPAGKQEQQHPAMSQGDAVRYEAALGQLSFINDRITDTGFQGDPVLNAIVHIPEFFLVGAFDSFLIFAPSDLGLFDIAQDTSTFLQAQLPLLTYDVANNTFFGELTDLTFASLGSSWIAALADLFNPESASFDPARKFWFTYAPQENLFSQTAGFTMDGESSGVNALFAAPAASPVPEPSALALLALGVLSASSLRWMQRRHGTTPAASSRRLPCPEGQPAPPAGLSAPTERR